MSDTPPVSGTDRRSLLRTAAAGVAGGLVVWTAPAIIFATPAGALTVNSIQYSALISPAWTWEVTTDPTGDLGGTTADWAGCKPSGWTVGTDPAGLPVPTVTVTGGEESGEVVFTAHPTCRIVEAMATVERPGTSGGPTYTCQTASIPAPTSTGNTATFAALPSATGDTRMAFRLRLECGS